jgi:DNA ligase-3
MGDNEEDELKPFEADRAKRVAKCKKCKNDIPKNELRIAKINPHNPFGSGPMKLWHHFDCLFEIKVKRDGQQLDSIDLIQGFHLLGEEDKDRIIEKINTINPNPVKTTKAAVPVPVFNKGSNFKEDSKDNSFREFRRIVTEITNESGYLKKTAILNKFLIKGSNEKQFEGDIYLWLKLLMPGVIKRVYNIQSKQIVKLFARIFGTNLEEMQEDLNRGDAADTIGKFFEQSRKIKPCSKSNLTIQEVDKFLEKLSMLTQEDPQRAHFENICGKCTRNDLVILIRLIKHDLRMNAGGSHILDALNSEAYKKFQSCKDLSIVLSEFANKVTAVGTAPKSKSNNGLQLMIPIAPQLAEACKDLDKAMAKAPFYSEIKYDGERVQIHKKGKEFK